jgi:hypothetical protein
MIESRGYFVSDRDVSHVIDKMDKSKKGAVSY